MSFERYKTFVTRVVCSNGVVWEVSKTLKFGEFFLP
jgi:hypothetical protein